MNILIIGAGSHGKLVTEVAEACGYDNAVFLDDNNPAAIGKLSEIERFRDRFDYAFVSIGNNALREQLIHRLETAGYVIPKLIHPTAYISKSAQIGNGTLVCPMAVINTNVVVGNGCFISAGAIVDHNAVIGECCHINAGAVVKAGAHIKAGTKLDAGQVALGY